jgi:hypothetical protein
MKQEQPKPDVRQMTAKLRSQVCSLLRLDESKLTPGDEILVARVGTLRVLVSDAEAAQLRGERIDLPLYLEASRALEDALRGDHRMSEGSPAALEAARQKMREVLMTIAPEIVEASDAEDREAAERAQAELELASEPDPPSDLVAGAAPPSNVKYLSTRRGPNGEHPQHYLKRREPWENIEVPYFPLPKDYR